MVLAAVARPRAILPAERTASLAILAIGLGGDQYLRLRDPPEQMVRLTY
jgi:hypothetical protein